MLRADAQAAVDAMVGGDKWVTSYTTGPRSGATPGDYLDTQVFATKMRTLAEFVRRSTADCTAQNY